MNSHQRRVEVRRIVRELKRIAEASPTAEAAAQAMTEFGRTVFKAARFTVEDAERIASAGAKNSNELNGDNQCSSKT